MKREHFVQWTVLVLSTCYCGLARSTDSSHTSLAKKSSHASVCDDVAVGVKDNFTHYVLAQVYPPAYCRSSKKLTCSNLADMKVAPWTIHGLWPTQDETIGPLCCDPNAGFNDDSIKDLLPKLMEKWVNLELNHTSYDFWKHEWLKHGTCCPNSLHPEHNYLNHTLTLFESGLNVDKFLLHAAAKPIEPRPSPYKLKTILAAFGDGIASELVCSSNIGESERNTLIEVRICLDKNFNPKRCPRPTRYERCGNDTSSDVYYIPPQPDDPSG